MKKIILSLLSFLLIFSLVGCKKIDYDNFAPGENSGEGEKTNLNIAERKIIYVINSDLIVENLDTAIDAIHNAKNVDEWFESEEILPRKASIIVRIKSNRIDEFKEALKKIGRLENYTLKATEISLEYSGTAEAIAAYEAERARLLVLYENAHLSDMVEINRQLREIDTELRRLNRKKNEYDSLIEYSSITLNISSTKDTSKPTFGHMAKSAFSGGLKAFITFFQYILILIIAIFPFAVVTVPTILIIKKYSKRKNNKNL